MRVLIRKTSSAKGMSDLDVEYRYLKKFVFTSTTGTIAFSERGTTSSTSPLMRWLR